MASGVEDLQILRLIRAFQKLTDQAKRQMVIRYIEEQVEKNAKSNPLPPGIA
jgi:DNA-binding FrmR family transcriptional regulator